jgi:assimilatory nitrate reductase catalytic subunit
MTAESSPQRQDNPGRLSALFVQRDGELTRDLTLAPGDFGLGQIPAKRQVDATATVVCGFCSTGCGLNIHLSQGAAVGLTPATDYPVNNGMACPKGWEALAVLQSEERATTPLLKNAAGVLEPVGWDTALVTFCDRFKAIQKEHGPESVAFLSTGQIATEEMALLGSLAKFGMGMVHGDGNTRQCMATAVVAYKQAFGFDAPPYTYQDLEESDVIVLVGANLCAAHPIMWDRVCRNPHQPRIIVIDPRRTETAMAATTHLALRPKSDLALFYGVAAALLREGWVDRSFIAAHTEGFEAFAEHAAQFPPDRVAEITGISERAILDFARTIHEGKRVSFWWTMGVNQSHEGVRTAQALINLALMTGNIGRPGTGANSITGQCNAMGSRIFSNTTNLLGGREFQNADHRREVAEMLGISAERIPSQNSWAYDEIIAGIRAGKIKGLWVIATNPAHSWIDQNALDEILGNLEFLVVQDMYHTTETARRAHLVLPAGAWGEKEGTFINSERRIGLMKKVARAPGQALADFSIFKLVAHYWGCEQMFADWVDPEAVFQILKKLSKGRPCDITGITDYRMLDEARGIQWPCPEGMEEVATHRRLFEDGAFYHPDRKARFLFEAPRAMAEEPSDAYPFLLNTGRGSVAQWHTQTRTSKSAVLRSLAPQQIYVEINPHDARTRGITPSQMVVVESPRGRIEAKAVVTYSVAPGQVFIPMHYATANQLTHASFDPYSRQPSYKACAVRVTPVRNWGRTRSTMKSIRGGVVTGPTVAAVSTKGSTRA